MNVSVNHDALRKDMVRRQLAGRGIRSQRVLDAMGIVRREGYVPSYLGEFAYDDTPLPIEEEQTISQPYIVAVMADALQLKGGEKVLEIGTGSGYAAAVLGQIAAAVYTIERHERLAKTAGERLQRDGFTNVHVRCGDGTLGWPEAAPFDAIVVAAGGPEVPKALREQLAIGGRLVIPVGKTVGLQELVRVTRLSEGEYSSENLASVRFVPLIGEEGWHVDTQGIPRKPLPLSLAEQIRAAAEPIAEIAAVDLDSLLERIGEARVVLMGEASHGTAEFYAMRARITQELIERKGFDQVAVEADWPDAARIDHYVRDLDVPPAEWQAFARFPTWMWRNSEVSDFVEWLRAYNSELPHRDRVRFAGLDLYSMYTSINAVLAYLESIDPPTAALARERYGCLTPWQSDPAAYGRAALTGHYRSCERDVVHMLQDLLEKKLAYSAKSAESFFDATQNARLIANAESYYRVMYYGGHESWNLRDSHMFATLQNLLEFRGSESKAIIWAHNSHIGNAAFTEMSARGELNIGQLSRDEWGDGVYSIGFGTDSGTVAAASYWDGPMEVKRVRPAHEDSYEFLCHEASEPRFLLPLRYTGSNTLPHELLKPRLERAIGVIYRPETELASHYFQAVLPQQFDEYVWFDQTNAVRPLATHEIEGMPDTWPFGL
jgi:protein-L-isoaspartate(D-aspartate) O-methyltransferase